MLFEYINTTVEDTLLIGAIVKKYSEDVGIHVDRMSRMMDLEVVHNQNPLRLQDMLEDETGSRGHDVAGIARYLDRKTGELTECFSPRFTA